MTDTRRLTGRRLWVGVLTLAPVLFVAAILMSSPRHLFKAHVTPDRIEFLARAPVCPQIPFLSAFGFASRDDEAPSRIPAPLSFTGTDRAYRVARITPDVPGRMGAEVRAYRLQDKPTTHPFIGVTTSRTVTSAGTVLQRLAADRVYTRAIPQRFRLPVGISF